MTDAAEVRRRAAVRRTRRRRVVGFTVTAAIGIGVFWLIRALPTICPAVDPAPASCAADVRVAPAMLATLVVLAVWTAGTVATLVPNPPRILIALLRFVLVAVILVGAGATLVASGFAVGFPG